MIHASTSEIQKDLCEQLGDAIILSHSYNGRENLTYLVKYKNKDLILRVYITKSVTNILDELCLLNHIARHLNVSRPININGQEVFYFDNRPAVFFEKINAPQINYQLPNPKIFFQIGHDLGLLHVNTSSHAYRSFWCEKEIEKTIIDNSILSKFILKTYNIDIEKEVNMFCKLKVGPCVIHGDISFNNLCYDDINNKIYFLDFDDSTKSCVGLDIGIAFRNLFLKTGIDTDYFKYFINGYLETNFFDFYTTSFWLRVACLRYVFHMNYKSLRVKGYKNDLRKNLMLLSRCNEKNIDALIIKFNNT